MQLIGALVPVDGLDRAAHRLRLLHTFRIGWNVPDLWTRVVSLLTAIAAIAFGGNLAIGAAFGIAAVALAKLAKKVRLRLDLKREPVRVSIARRINLE